MSSDVPGRSALLQDLNLYGIQGELADFIDDQVSGGKDIEALKVVLKENGYPPNVHMCSVLDLVADNGLINKPVKSEEAETEKEGADDEGATV